MGGAVSGVAGANWMLIGDAAACVNPLNGEGIDYGLETGRLAAELLDGRDLAQVWPALLRQHYGRGFSVARRLALLLTFQRFLPATGPIAMRSTTLMTIAVRVMANLVTDEDADWVARAWRAGPAVAADRPPHTVQLSGGRIAAGRRGRRPRWGARSALTVCRRAWNRACIVQLMKGTMLATIGAAAAAVAAFALGAPAQLSAPAQADPPPTAPYPTRGRRRPERLRRAVQEHRQRLRHLPAAGPAGVAGQDHLRPD